MGKFFSKSIPRRESSWRHSLGKYAKEGMDLCVDRFSHIKGIPKARINTNTVYFEKYKNGSYNMGKCYTDEKPKTPLDECMSIDGYQAE